MILPCDRQFWVYILTNVNRTLYVGVTKDLIHRLADHKAKQVPGFTARYGLDILVYVEEYASIAEAIAREKQLKKWTRAKKVALIERANPEWEEMAV